MNNKEKIRWAILGAGKIARKFVHDFQLTNGAELVAVASSDLERARVFAKEFSIANAYTHEELYNNREIDVVYIATTHNSHFIHSRSCLENNKAVLCEKPITVNAGECRQLQMIAKERKVFLMEALWTYFLPSVYKAKEWIGNGRIGKLSAIHANFGYSMEYDAASRLYNPSLAGGALLDLGIYPIAISTYFANKQPVAVFAAAVFSDTGVDETTNIILKYEDGISSLLFTSMVIQTLNSAFLYGDKGYIEIPDFFKAFSVRLFDSSHNLIETFEDKRVGFGYEFQIQHVTDNLLSGKLESDVVTHSGSLLNQEIMMQVRDITGLRYPMEK
ncbi:MAG TPA: Gfo/Idh/MocA family oxidoreductase [Flavisolibacter sp.]|nr:Gfo/Idh/MocA family oxidoreductase [Flavisolibacter sp.]